MKTTSICVPAIALSLAIPAPNVFSQGTGSGAKEIAKEFEAKKAAALDEYLAGNEDADDRDEALELLIAARTFLGETAEVALLLEDRYESLEKGPGANLEILIGQVARPLVEAYRQAGNKEGARKFIGAAKEDLKDHPAAPQINRFFDGLLGQLNQPGVGDVMEIPKFQDPISGEEVDPAKILEENKVVLVDFWATWCGPCVAELPNVLEAYAGYKDKGFEIIGISLDQDEDALKKFVANREGMSWPQQFDGKGWENEISSSFGITSIPATFLIGEQDGKKVVIATDLRDSQLEDELKKRLGE